MSGIGRGIDVVTPNYNTQLKRSDQIVLPSVTVPVKLGIGENLQNTQTYVTDRGQETETRKRIFDF